MDENFDCIACCQINSYNSKTLPLYCPANHHKFCKALNLEKILDTNGSLSKEFIAYLKQFDQKSICLINYRYPIDSTYVCADFIQYNCKQFLILQKVGNKKIYVGNAY